MLFKAIMLMLSFKVMMFFTIVAHVWSYNIYALVHSYHNNALISIFMVGTIYWVQKNTMHWYVYSLINCVFTKLQLML